MAKTFVIANQKGGVGKTTTSVNLAAALAKLGRRTLLVDLDPQGNATMGSGIDKRALEHSVYELLIGQCALAEAVRPAGTGGYDVLPANRELAGAEVELVALERRETRLRDALAEAEDRYDFVLIDCPPSLSLLTLNGFCAANGVIIPMQCEYYALEGLSDLVNTIRKVHANFNTRLQVIGLLRVMFDPRMTLSQQVSAQLEQHFGDKVFGTIIPRNVRLAEAPSYGMPGVEFDPGSKGAKAYIAFAGELIERLDRIAAGAAAVRTPAAPRAASPAAPSADTTAAASAIPARAPAGAPAGAPAAASAPAAVPAGVPTPADIDAQAAPNPRPQTREQAFPQPKNPDPQQ